MSIPAVFLPLDLTGQAADNYIVQEYHQIAAGDKTVIRPNFGNFFREGFQLFGVSTESNIVALRPELDYELAELDAQSTAKAQGEVYKLILIKDTRYFTTFRIDYHALGGPENINYTRLYTLTQKAKDGRASAWENLQNKPQLFEPQAHVNDAKDVYGLEVITQSLNELASAITSANTHQGRYAEVRAKLRSFETEMAASNASISTVIRQHIDSSGYLHNYTKASFGLGNVANYGFTPLVISGQDQPHYAHPNWLNEVITNPPAATVSTHPSQTNNPHQDTKESIGLANVANYSVQINYTLNEQGYQALFDPQATVVYLGAYVFNKAISEYSQDQLDTVVLPQVSETLGQAQENIVETQLSLNDTEADLTNANAALQTLQTTAAAIDDTVAQAQNLNNRFQIVNANAIYANTLIQILIKDRELAARGASLYEHGNYPIPAKIDSLELWLSANNPKNKLLVDFQNRIRLMELVDSSVNDRRFSSTIETAPYLQISDDQIVEQTPSIRFGQVIRFEPGLTLTQSSGPVFQLKPGMAVVGLVRSGGESTHLDLLTAPNAISPTGIYCHTSGTRRQLSIRSGSNWRPLDTPNNASVDNTSFIFVAVVDDELHAKCWYASSQPLNYTLNPRGVATPVSTWPATSWASAALTQLGNAGFDSDNQGELVELIVYRRTPSAAELRAVVEYLKTVYTNSQALSVNFAATNAF